MLKRNFHPEQGISLSPQQDLGRQVYKTILRLKWETFYTHLRSYSHSLCGRVPIKNNYTMHRRFLALQGKIWFNFVNCRLKPSTHSTTITLDRMCLIHSIVKGRKIDVGVILHQEIADCTARQTRILVFPSLVMLLCQQKGIVPRASEEVLENNGLINKASVERMTRGKDTLILKEAETSKIRKAKAKVNNKGTNLNPNTSLWRKMKDIGKNGQFHQQQADRHVATIEDMEKSQNFFMHIPEPGAVLFLFEDGIFADQEDTVVEKEVAVVEEEVVVVEEEVVAKEEVVKNEKEKEEEYSVEKTIAAPEFVGANIDNLEPLQVASRTQEATDDAGAEPGTEEQSEDCAKPNEKKWKHSKDKKVKAGGEENEEKETSCSHFDGCG
ncbi:hypothetical protein Gotri_023954 [Gossypium trilobum]|uniref:Putative plant transposon protein domain-containing protein n=1 Tax=Gossypium trilobum TaxID=34281 RepID=A0A7J9DKN5_9ROSI|nr:hypothetical protein [Gossypium trilobum]